MKSGYLYKICYLFYVLIFAWLITHGDFNLFKGEGNYAFDSLSSSLLNFQCSVEKGAINWEAFVINNKNYMYFGPFPALLRIVLNFIFPGFFGMWSLFSCMLASMLCVAGFSFLIKAILDDSNTLPIKLRRFFLFISQFTFALGTPIFFLMIGGSIYHESILWGLSFSILSIAKLYDLLKTKTDYFTSLFMFSLLAGLALLSKITYGLPLYAILIAYIIKMIVVDSRKNTLRLLTASIPAWLALIFQFWYNSCRFGNMFTFINYKYYYPWILYPQELEKFQKIGILNLKRIPSAAFNYLGLRPEYFSFKAPFFNFSLPVLANKSVFMNYQEHVISLTIVSLFFTIASIISIYWMIKEKNQIFVKFCALSFLGQIIFILAFSFGITHRYLADFIPFYVFMYSYFIFQIGNKKSFSVNNSTKLIAIGIVLSLFSIIATIFSTFDIILKTFNCCNDFKASIEDLFTFINNFTSWFSF